MFADVLIDRPWKRMLWIAAFAALAYLPGALQLRYYRDDWYYAYDAMVGPVGVFRYMFAADRPARGPFFEIYHALFGIAPGPYHAAMLFWRIVGGAAVVWLFHLLWPRRAFAGLIAGTLFALYPGFTWWVQAIEYQPMVASAALMVVSFGLTLLALRPQRLWPRLACIAGAILTGWIYLALVEYAAGMEVFRLCLIFAAVIGPQPRTFRDRAAIALRRWIPYLIIPLGFLIWRFAFFASTRKATDLGVQLSGLLADPLSTGLHWLMNLLFSLINVMLAAWVQPLLNSFFALDRREQILGLALALAAAVLAWRLLRPEQALGARKRPVSDESWQLQALWLGLAGLILGIAPVIVANRQVSLPSFSHYALPASLGLVIMAAGLVAMFLDRRMQIAAVTALIFLGVLTHQGLGLSALREERTIAAFWHQMAWRAPSIAPGTTLLVYYPGVDFGTDSDVVWGPADFIYYPQTQAKLPVDVQLAALTHERANLNAVLAGRDVQQSAYRAHTMTIDYGSVLIAVQSATDGCVRVLDSRWPAHSSADDPALWALAATSRVDAIEVSGQAPRLPRSLFGPEPAHGWCYYFARASLAAQQGDWAQVAAIQDEVGKLGLHPNDQIEWMPFLQAQAYLGDLAAVKEIATRINTERLYRQQACSNLSAMADHGYPLSPEAQAYVNDVFRCNAR